MFFIKKKDNKYIMNKFLNFTQPQIRTKYQEYLSQRLFKCIFLLHILIIIKLLYSLINMVIFLSKNEDYILLGFDATLIFAIVGVIWLFIFIIVAIYFYWKKNTYSDFCLLGSFFYFLAFSKGLLLDPTMSTQSHFFFTMMSIMFLFVYRSLCMKSIHLMGNMAFYMALNNAFSEKKSFENYELIVHNIFFSIFVIVTFYYREKAEKQLFLKSYTFDKDKKTLNELMNILPEGAAIFSNNLKTIMINNSLRFLYEEQSNEKLQEKILKETKRKNPLFSNTRFNYESMSEDFSDRRSQGYIIKLNKYEYIFK